MPRKGPPSRRPLTPDPIYQSQLVTQMVNKILLQGKRSTAERIVYPALEQCRRKTGNDPVTTLKRAVENVRPVLETKSRRVGGGTYQGPVEGGGGRCGRPRAAGSAGRPPRSRSRSGRAARRPWPCAGWSTSPGPAARRPWPTGVAVRLWTPPTDAAPPRTP